MKVIVWIGSGHQVRSDTFLEQYLYANEKGEVNSIRGFKGP